MDIGDRVYLCTAIAGEPGRIIAAKRCKFLVEWPDMPEVGITQHKADMLILANMRDDRHNEICKLAETKDI